MSIKDFIFKKEKVSSVGIITPNKTNKLLKQFLEEYPLSSVLPFRKKSKITCNFGLANGYKISNGNMEWGYVRIHPGVDRSAGGDAEFDWGNVPNVVRSPFNANRTSMIDYKGKSYGTLMRMFMDKYGFEFRVAHMNPFPNNISGNIIEWSKQQFILERPFKQGWVLGSAGTYGNSSGIHTHSEIKSIGETSEVLDALLLQQYGPTVESNYYDEEVFNLYRLQLQFSSASDKEIFSDYNQLKKEKKINMMNQYKIVYTDWDESIKTRYNPSLLFKGL